MAKLTEQDIINWKGPEEEYMNADQLAFFRELLVKLQDELIQKAADTTGHLQSHEAAPDPAVEHTVCALLEQQWQDFHPLVRYWSLIDEDMDDGETDEQEIQKATKVLCVDGGASPYTSHR